MRIEVSNGEIVDKLTIIEIKLEQIADQEKKNHLLREYEILAEALTSIISKDHPLYLELLEINRQLWKIEDDIRALERKKDFGEEFVKLARSVYFTNDKRSEVKNKINVLSGSSLKEVKSYESYL